MIKVLMVGQVPKEIGGSYTTGVANVIKNLAYSLNDKSCLSIFATNYQNTFEVKNSLRIFGISKKDILLDLVKKFFSNPISILKSLYLYKYRFGAPSLRMLIYELRLRQILRNGSFNIVHIHNIMYLAVLNRLNYTHPVILTFHGIFSRDLNAINYNKNSGLDLLRLYSRSASLISNVSYLNEEMKEICQEDLNLKNIKYSIIGNGIEVEKFKYSEKDRIEVRDRLGILDQEILLITVGSIQDRKGQLRFVDFLIKNKINVKYLIIGKDTYKNNKFKNAIENPQIKDQIIFLEYINNYDLFKYYSAADLYIHSSSSEGQALVVLEALACGLPACVNKDIKGTLGLDDSYNNFYSLFSFENNSLPDFDLLVDRDLLSNKARNDFNWDKIAQKYIDFYKFVDNDNIKE